MGSISGIRADSFRVLLGDASRLWPRGDGEWHDMLKRCTPVKEGAAIPGEWARLVIKHTEERSLIKETQLVIMRLIYIVRDLILIVCIGGVRHWDGRWLKR